MSTQCFPVICCVLCYNCIIVHFLPLPNSAFFILSQDLYIAKNIPKQIAYEFPPQDLFLGSVAFGNKGKSVMTTMPDSL